MKKLFTILLSLICTGISAQVTLSKTMVHNSLTREYKIYIPANYTGSAQVPLLLNLHGYGSDMDQQEAYGDFRPIADTAGFIIVHPNGTYDTSLKRFWNAYGVSTVDDLGFLSALIDSISASYMIDPQRVYSTGLSNGAIMSYFLACNLSSKITAIGPVAGSMTPAMKNSCNATHPTPVIAIHGTADAVVAYSGSSVFMHTDSVISYWRSFNNCNATPVVTNVPNTSMTDGCTATRYDYLNGNGGSNVAFYKITNGGHSWPGAPVNIAVTNHDFSASVEIWKFFRKFRRNLLSGVSESRENQILIYPNPAGSDITINIAEPSQLFIYDLTGKTVLKETVVSGMNTISVSSLECGIYFVKLRTADSELSTKLVKQ